MEMVQEALDQTEERAEEVVEDVKKRYTESDKAKEELQQVRPRSNSKLSGMIGMFEKKVEEINSTLTPGVNKLAAKESPRGDKISPRPRSNSGSLSDRANMFEKKVEDNTETRSRSNSGVKDESPRPRSNSGKLNNMVGMFEKKVEEINTSLTPGVNAPKPPKPTTTTTARKNSFGRAVEEEKPVEEKKKFKFDVKVTTLTSEKKNTDLLNSAVKEESWEKRRSEEEEEDEQPRPRKSSLSDEIKKQWENTVAV